MSNPVNPSQNPVSASIPTPNQFQNYVPASDIRFIINRYDLTSGQELVLTVDGDYDYLFIAHQNGTGNVAVTPSTNRDDARNFILRLGGKIKIPKLPSIGRVVLTEVSATTASILVAQIKNLPFDFWPN